MAAVPVMQAGSGVEESKRGGAEIAEHGAEGFMGFQPP